MQLILFVSHEATQSTSSISYLNLFFNAVKFLSNFLNESTDRGLTFFLCLSLSLHFILRLFSQYSELVCLPQVISHCGLTKSYFNLLWWIYLKTKHAFLKFPPPNQTTILSVLVLDFSILIISSWPALLLYVEKLIRMKCIHCLSPTLMTTCAPCSVTYLYFCRLLFCGFCLFVETESYYVTLICLELSMQIRLT